MREDGGIELDQTCFYATSGGQPGDTGFLERADGIQDRDSAITRHGETKDIILHMPLDGDSPCPRSAKSWCCMSIGRAATS